MDEPSTLLLPVLGDADLRAIFRSDERAIWRYRLLKALLHEGYTIREAAQQFGTTPETVRHLRSAFLETGHLDVLRSKRRGAAGHLLRQTPLAQAVAQELAADPDASGGTVWRRVKASLNGSGIAVPRRSVYRLVDRLRAQAPQAAPPVENSDLWAPALVPALRAALPLLALEPPLDLGRSDLAQQTLAQEPEPLTRGQLLREMLLQALDELKPSAGDDPHDPAYRPYQILVGEGLRGRSRDELQHEFHIAPATYTRAKRQGLERLAESIVYRLGQQQMTIAHAEPPAPPPLLGRDREVAYYSRRLHDGEAVIWGLAGCGKTALAATLAGQYQQAGAFVVWHVCSGTGDLILQSLLLSCGVDRDSQSLDTATLLNALRERLTDGSVVVLEQYERIADDPTTALLIAMLRSAVKQQGVRLLVVSRVLPPWAEDEGWLPLGGLGDDAARALWTVSGGQTVEPSDWQALYNRTLGYPQLMQRLIDEPAIAIAAVVLEQLGAVSAAAQQTLFQMILAQKPLRIADDPPATVEPTVRSPYQELYQYGLLTYQAGERCYHLHSLLQASRAEMIPLINDSAQIYRMLGQRIAGEGGWLEAAAAFTEGGEIGLAMQLIRAHLDDLIAQGHGPEALDLLKRLLFYLTPGPDLAEAQGLSGSCYLTLGMYREAIDALGAALDVSALFRDSIAPLALRRWNRLLAEAYLQLGRWSRALPYAQASISIERTIGEDVSAEERIALALLQQRIWVQAGQIEQARYWLADAQMQAQICDCATGSGLVAYAEGVDAARRGRFEQAIKQLQQALELLPATTHHTERFEIVALLGRCQALVGQFELAEALLRRWLNETYTIFHRSGTVELALSLVCVTLGRGALDEAAVILRLAESLHDPANLRQSVELKLIQGWHTLHTDNISQSLAHFTTALAIASDPALPEFQVQANLSIACSTLRQGDATTAAQYAARALRQAESLGLDRCKALAQLCLVEEALLRHDWDEAEQGLKALRVLDADPLLQGQFYFTRAQLLSAVGEQSEAQTSLQTGLAQLRSGPQIVRHWAEQSASRLFQAS
ncbi:MAG TPA: helix-turn-helix domain-containing protein [Herpetosiphonaceae bacterium]